ncbi:MAG: transglycosylase SLT domain-containing protein [Chloroflexota bacterium]|nr:transglycosylase SLT domain-containing protein [Chloroflexota bacterium]
MLSHRTHPAARALALVLVIGALAAACRGSKSRGEPSSSSTPALTAPGTVVAGAPRVTPTATTSPADSKLGDRLRYEGEFEGAAGVYAAVASEATGDKQQAARLAQAQVLTRIGRHADARAPLDAYVAADTNGDGNAARYMLGSTLDDLGDLPGAIDSYSRYIAAGGVLSDFARVERAKLLARLGRVAEAEAAAQEVLASPLLPSFKGSFAFSIARAFEQGGADTDALAWYDRAKADGDVASALARSGAIKKRLNDPTWVSDYTLAVDGYPDSAVATDLLDALDAAGVSVSDYTRGVVSYRASRNDAARGALARAIAAADHAAESTYYLAALDERLGDTAGAIAGYQRAHDLDPASSLADNALWWRSRLLEQSARYDEAGAGFAALAAGYPTSVWRADANFHRGLVQYRAGDAAAAAATWGSLVALVGEDDAPRLRFWQARALMDAGDATAQSLLRALHNDLPANFYGLRAELLLKKNDGKDHRPKLSDDRPDWNKIATYLKEKGGTDVSVAPAQDPRWDEAAELRAVGLNAQSEVAARAVLSEDSRDVSLTYADMRAAQEAGQTSLAARAATTLIASLPAGAPEPPAALLRIAYPGAYSDLVTDAAKQQGVSSTLLLALVRQESYYDPDAGSDAGALGLTQVVPSTGEAIANDLGVAAFSPNDLYRPKLSLNFGASYLADQLKQFDGDPYHALAAYNGGPGTASSAIKSAGDDEDLFVEDLEFDETQRYVRLVMENYARYRQLYEGVDRPSLPR